MAFFRVSEKLSRQNIETGNSYFFRHALDHTIKIYWLFDVPRLLKCTRNHILKHKKVQYAGETARFIYYERLYNLEKK
ncbi:hypothetical protein OUZ56_011322 [Daphnia magna]|uniref:Uncharacterized protein n=1 Tax=Daphnia magna TaxID=35525 RepID=A0ABQ9YZS9_9CRUS|nr:hypothetical protein OUZ56_011322 [Daphnia magna]